MRMPLRPLPSHRPSRLRSALPLTLLAVLGACGGSSGGGGASIDLQTLSGRITGPGGVPLPGVSIDFEDRETETDAAGVFVLPAIGQLATGSYLVGIDGTTSTAAGNFPALEVMVDVVVGKPDLALPQVIALPDLDSAEAANQSVAVDGTGAVTEAIDLTGPAGDIELDGPVGTVVTVHDEIPVAGVDFNVTPVVPTEVPMPLPDGLFGSSFVTIQPGAGRFATPGGGGLDVRLPNDAGLPVDTVVDIWSFDHDDGAWVNRSTETGNTGLVVDLGGGMTAIDATGVITEGGWHAPVIPVDPECATTLTGRVIDDLGQGLEDVSIATSLGNFGTTDASGNFSIPTVAAYVIGAEVCTPVGLQVTAAAPPLLGSIVSGSIDVADTAIVAGGTTDVGDITLSVPNTGCVAGIVNGTLASPGELVAISGPTTTSVAPSASGSFFVCGLDPGSYTASVTFMDDTEPTTAAFDVVANGVATVTLQKVTGGGSGTLEVTVLRRNDGEADPVAGAFVFVEGTDASSAGGLLMSTNGSGIATFQNVDGPFDVTAWSETSSAGPFGTVLLREAATVVQIDPASGQVGLLLGLEDVVDGGNPPVADAELSLTIIGNTASCPVRIEAQTRGGDPENPAFENSTQTSGTSATLAVPSGELIDVYFTTECGTGTTDTTGFGYVFGLAALTPGEMRAVDIDLTGSSFVEFDQAVPVTITGEEAGGFASRDGELILRDTTTGVLAEVDLFNEFSSPAPTTWDLPALDAAALSGFETVIESGFSVATISGSDPTSTFQAYGERLGATTPASLAIDLLAAPSLTTPTTPFDVPMAAGLPLQWVPSPVPSGASGLELIDLLSFEGFGGPAAATTRGNMGGDTTVVFWNFYLAQGSTDYTLPSVADDILEDGTYAGGVQSIRFEGVAFDFETFFSPDVNTQFEAVTTDFDRQRQSAFTFQGEIGSQAP